MRRYGRGRPEWMLKRNITFDPTIGSRLHVSRSFQTSFSLEWLKKPISMFQNHNAWNRQRKQSLGTQKSSTKLLPQVTYGFDSASSPWDSEIINKTASTGDTWIRQRKQPLWTPKSSTKTESLSSQKSSTKLLLRVTHWFHSAKSPCGLWNHQRKLSCWRLRNHQRNCFHGWHVDSTEHTTPAGLKIITENLVTVDSEIINESASTGDAWFDNTNSPWDS
jgi:hypothetical protein